MIIIGVDYHPSFQQIAFMDQETGEYGETGIESQRWRSGAILQGTKRARSQRARGDGGHPGMHAGSSGYWRSWVSSLWIGDPAEIKTKRVRKQKPTGRMPDSC